jgi:hypothetical protein
MQTGCFSSFLSNQPRKKGENGSKEVIQLRKQLRSKTHYICKVCNPVQATPFSLTYLEKVIENNSSVLTLAPWIQINQGRKEKMAGKKSTN